MTASYVQVDKTCDKVDAQNLGGSVKNVRIQSISVSAHMQVGKILCGSFSTFVSIILVHRL